MDLVDRSKETLLIASKALACLAENLPRDFIPSVKKLLSCKRLVVTTGVGKSGFIAQKMAATLTSTGTPAIFLDPMNGLHGDLGIVSSDDVLICYSYSGEANELLALLPTINHRNVPIISIVGRENSSLGNASDLTIVGPIEKEACPLNLAPTTSTTVAMGISDALAVAIMSEKNYQAEDFALNHPAGSLGRRLTLRVHELIVDDSADNFLHKSSSFQDVICGISSSGVGAVCILDERKNVVGLITDGDIRRHVEITDGALLGSLKAKDMMSKEPVSIELSSFAVDALNLMEKRSSQISVLPVTNSKGEYAGMIRLHDLVKAGL